MLQYVLVGGTVVYLGRRSWIFSVLLVFLQDWIGGAGGSCEGQADEFSVRVHARLIDRTLSSLIPARDSLTVLL